MATHKIAPTKSYIWHRNWRFREGSAESSEMAVVGVVRRKVIRVIRSTPDSIACELSLPS
jgi:hypothetical protein